MTEPTVRVRFAPSPTGFLHLGNARTAVFNWLYARHTGGVFVLRVEDTDRERSTLEAERVIFEAMEWLGLTWDEGPFHQSERNDLYRSHAERLLAEGKAYHCWCTPEEIEERRQAALAAKQAFIGYDGRCRDRKDPRPGVNPVIRFRSPDEGRTTWVDLNQGEISVENVETDDLVILRADGTPTYNFTVVVDDAAMGITHVIRGADHITNTPRQIQLYRAFGFKVPFFAHHGLVLGPDRSKLSKRHGAVSVTQYREMGFLPGAMINALARLGWSHGDQEIFTREELVNLFDIKDVSSAGAIFDFEKLKSLFNHEHIKRSDLAVIGPLLREHFARIGIELPADDPRLPWAIEAGRERGKTMADMAELLKPLFADQVQLNEKDAAKNLKPEIRGNLEALAGKLEALPDWSPAALMEVYKKTAEDLGVGLGKVAQPARVALTGSSASPPIDLVTAIIGRERSLRRIRNAMERIRSVPSSL